jgi:polyferredoxin
MLTILFFFLASFFIKDSYCKICPLGALNGLFNKGSLLNIEKDSSKCTYCGNCYLACPMQLSRIYTERVKKNVDRTFCIRCFRCVDVCPETGCLKVKFSNFTIMGSK